jgi:hypothetical protein
MPRLVMVRTHRLGKDKASTKAERRNGNRPEAELEQRLSQRSRTRSRLAELYRKGVEQLQRGGF